jgi:hypothetical protein
MVALVASAWALVLSSCLVESKGVIMKNMSAVIAKQNCAAPNAVAVKNIANRLIASGTEVSSDFCSKIESYSCYSRVFSPTAVDGQSSEQECSSAPELGGDFCMKLSTRIFSTREASSLPDTAPGALRPGGEFNRTEYVCHQSQLKDGEEYLAIGEGETLKEAVLASYAKCASVAPRLTASKE